VTDETAPDSTMSKSHGIKGRMMVVYLPEGSVTLDATEIDLGNLSPGALDQFLSSHSSLELSNQLLPPKIAHKSHLPKKRKMRWIHGINIAFITYMLIVNITPMILTNYLNVAIYPSKVAHPGVSIFQGDLMIASVMPIADLKINDVLLVRDSNTWNLDVRQVMSKASSGDMSIVVTVPTGGLPINKTYILQKSTDVHKITNIIPKLGYVPIVLASTMARIVAGLFWLIINIVARFRRARRGPA
jgi:hypothetical protein